jgi:F-type H+-transporting ATPase subunit delta
MDLRGASAGSVAALTEQLKTAVSGSVSAAATAADSLYSVSQTLRTEPALRRFATDGSVPTEAKVGLVREVFGGKLDQIGLDLVLAAVGRRWTRSGDLADGVERLSEVAAVLSAGADGGTLSDELFALGRIVGDSPALRDALSDPGRTTADKAGLLEQLLGGRALPATLTLAKQALSHTYGTATSALSAYRKLAADVHGESVATVRVARQLSEDQTRRLTAALAKQYRRPVHAKVVVDDAVVGGIRVDIGDDVIDGTIASRLDEAGRKLAG